MLDLFLRFFYIGLLSFGGGYTIVPLLYTNLSDFISEQTYMDLLAISQVTPGPIAINAATYIGAVCFGVAGSALTTLAVSLPSFFIVITLAKLYENFKNNRFAQGILRGLRPVTLSLIIFGGFLFSKGTLFDDFGFNPLAICFAIVAFLLTRYAKLNPIYCIFLGGAFGIIAF